MIGFTEALQRLDALNVVGSTSCLSPHLLEKNVWVVWSLRHHFAGPDAAHLVFKGGTSSRLTWFAARMLQHANNLVANSTDEVYISYERLREQHYVKRSGFHHEAGARATC